MKLNALGGIALLAIGSVNGAYAGEFSYTVGGGMFVAPDYEGSDEYEGGIMAELGVGYERELDPKEGETDYFFGLQDASLSLNNGLDLGIARLYRPEGMYRMGLGLGYGGGREASDNNDLRGLGDIDDYAEGALTLEYFSPDEAWNGGLTLSQDLSGETSGSTLTGYVGYTFPVADNITLTTAANVVWADDDHMQAYFGISDRQASNSIYSRYSAGSGLKSAGVDLTLNWMFAEDWAVIANTGYTRLSGDAADSPIVDQKGSENQFISMVGVMYQF
ncbi:MipA/OmpV family protein [Aestuariispira insulae]|uniref:Outer membrane scaffolding protein for murein synthesis (MipA/OmpV family) n=1 Tax=Aestuariispira insulae TaxID=1461337 RepID=A0A3D9HWT0_9PROT|nr:MipA/OmpV family protein [Aestuariispira insulae]RED53841.1 outer membrane scaffolding protein for murein synthesis (MipA/OmpV family) [Aestuariispira insulae]